ncbi:amino acid ABC transporter ATP-binding protein [Catenulispora yoronensis]|uniref:Amino acid ABC transporter ATP-binding protein n=1 Tax=Catenulispora yoronensis TaxID=450799 RepID=A0ABN2V3J3_9ACTN
MTAATGAADAVPTTDAVPITDAIPVADAVPIRDAVPVTDAAPVTDAVPAGIAAAVEIRGVTKSFGANRVLDGVDLTVCPGHVTVVIGPSGAGKSTLLRTINHLEKPDAGYVRVNGELIGVRQQKDHFRELPERAILAQRAEIGFVFQSFNLFPHLTALENVAAAPAATGRASKSEARERAAELLTLVGLADKLDAYPGRLSGGQQQRVAIARAMALRPGLILFDEPTSALDPELVGEVLAVMKDLAGTGTTLIVVTHEIGFAREAADTVVFMDAGRIVEQGPPRRVLDHPEHPRTREFLSKVL